MYFVPDAGHTLRHLCYMPFGGFRCAQLEARLAEVHRSLEEQKSVTGSMRREAARAHGEAEEARKQVGRGQGMRRPRGGVLQLAQAKERGCESEREVKSWNS